MHGMHISLEGLVSFTFSPDDGDDALHPYFWARCTDTLTSAKKG
jgi:hypothetical protein